MADLAQEVYRAMGIAQAFIAAAILYEDPKAREQQLLQANTVLEEAKEKLRA